ncbi:protein phosphatase 2C domain-containing protein [Metabacillus schmidteae]|uniref:protein phosphatase 2C domain-containing protein n=1 Tax=Metabacillus schmidteae TaxID=2730405 RepID=UPI00158DE987|nr:protein phosphatase 2C domain-containing protein [Metabacillus schmidteae]
MNDYRWVGSQKHFVDEIHTELLIKNVVIGHFGGNSSTGQYNNEDGCLFWINQEEDWEFAIILDAHNTAQSAELILTTFEKEKDLLHQILKLQSGEAFDNISTFILSIFKSEVFREACKNVQGETACLFVIRKDKFLWWLSIGDCILYLFHSELKALGEFQQNHRSFYEWVGQNNTFDLAVPCYSSGRKELRKGENHIFLTTDGLIECPNTKFDNPVEIFNAFDGLSNQDGVQQLLEEIKENNVRDSTTIISWKVTTNNFATLPSDI